LRRDLRSFRLDRVQAVEALPVSFGRPEDFDVLAYLKAAIAGLPRAYAVEVLLETDLASARRSVFVEMGLPEATPRGVLLRVQADDLEWVARELARLPFGFRILKPVALKRALVAQAQRMLALAGWPG
jgi:predicted DNA-binding transcriptional regulator YafY